jgi:hypothetical protein
MLLPHFHHDRNDVQVRRRAAWQLAQQVVPLLTTDEAREQRINAMRRQLRYPSLMQDLLRWHLQLPASAGISTSPS